MEQVEAVIAVQGHSKHVPVATYSTTVEDTVVFAKATDRGPVFSVQGRIFSTMLDV
jgi:hypothetical protein